jgi:hypothetical protein
LQLFSVTVFRQKLRATLTTSITPQRLRYFSVSECYFTIIQKIPQYLFAKANRRLPYGGRRLLLSLIFSSFPCFSKNLSLILEVFLSRLIYYLAPAFSKIIYAGVIF